MAPEATFDAFYTSALIEPGDFVKEAYSGSIRKDKDQIRLSMKRDGHFWRDGISSPLSMEKHVVLRQGEDTLFIDYVIHSKVGEHFRVGIEFNFSLLGSGGERYMETDQGRMPLTTKGVLEATSSVLLHDPYQNVDCLLRFGTPAEVWTFPVEVVSLSENGFERNYQSTMLMPVWYVEGTEEPTSIHMELRLRQGN